MIFLPNPTGLLGYGLQFSCPIAERCINRTGSTINQGEVVVLDLLATDVDVTNFRLGDKNSIFANVINTDAGSLDRSTMSVAAVFEDTTQTTLADNSAGRFVIFGIDVPVLCQKGATTGTTPTTDASHFGLEAATNVFLTASDATEVVAGSTIYAKATETGVALIDGTSTLVRCIFDGTGLATK